MVPVAVILWCGYVTPLHADRVSLQPVDARVIAKTVSGDGLVITIALPKLATHVVLDRTWTGAFVNNGKPIDKTEFTLFKVGDRIAFAKLKGRKDLPSEAVRLYPPGEQPHSGIR